MAANRYVENVTEENPFAIDLHNFLWNTLNHTIGDIDNPVKSYFNEDIGYAILYLQFAARRALHDALGQIQIKNVQDGLNVTRKLCRLRRRKKPENVFQAFLENCAIVAEVYLYLGYGLHLKVGSSTLILAWNFVFTRRRIQHLVDNGGWSKLNSYVKENYEDKRDFVEEQIEYLKDALESAKANQTFDPETKKVAADLKETFQSLVLEKKRAIIRERYRQSKEATRIRRIDERLIDDSEDRSGAPEPGFATETRNALRSHWRRLPEETEAAIVAVSDYVTSDDGKGDAESKTVLELCTMMTEAQIASERKKKKKQRRKKKSSQKSTAEDEQETVQDPPALMESASPVKASTSETFASSARPLKVPIPSPATSPTKPAAKSTKTKGSSGSYNTGKKGKKN